jgi:hypothetical protein
VVGEAFRQLQHRSGVPAAELVMKHGGIDLLSAIELNS